MTWITEREVKGLVQDFINTATYRSNAVGHGDGTRS